MMTMGAVTARLKAYDRQQRARRAYDASCLALRDGALTGACYLQRDAAKLYAEAQAFTKLADEGADANLIDGGILPQRVPASPPSRQQGQVSSREGISSD
jgi:hypothetical protein